MKTTKKTEKLEFYEILSNMTIEEIFQNSPSVDYFLREKESCSVRFPNQIAPKPFHLDRSQCMTIFNITRFIYIYIQRDFICYKISFFTLDFDSDLDLIEYTLAPYSSGVIYQMWLNDTFADVSYFTIFAHSTQTSDLYDSIFSRTRNYDRPENSSTDLPNLEVSFSRISIVEIFIHILQAPNIEWMD